MLAMDSFISLITWIPYIVPLFNPSIVPSASHSIYSLVSMGILVTNCFSTPILYFIFNKEYKVSIIFSANFDTLFTLAVESAQSHKSRLVLFTTNMYIYLVTHVLFSPGTYNSLKSDMDLRNLIVNHSFHLCRGEGSFFINYSVKVVLCQFC